MEGEDECLILFVAIVDVAIVDIAIVDAVVSVGKEALFCFVFVAFEESRFSFVHLLGSFTIMLLLRDAISNS